MINNAIAIAYTPRQARNSEGTIYNSWGYIGSVFPLGYYDDFLLWDDTKVWGEASDKLRADVQPATLTEAQLELWGLTNKASDIKKMFYDKSPAIVIPNRVKILFDDGRIETYDVRGNNIWNWHSEAYLVPIQGESA